MWNGLYWNKWNCPNLDFIQPGVSASCFLRGTHRAGPISVSYTPPPKDLPGFPGARPAKPLGNRKRWTDSDGSILEWDSRHGEIEMYDRTGKTHKGGFDPKTGNQISDPKPGRTTPKN